MNNPEHLRYAESHEWIEAEGDQRAVGISDHAQEELSDVVYVELPEVGREVRRGEAVAVVESVKAASDIYAPVDGRISAVNEALADSPETVNSEPYTGGWLFRIEASDPSQIEQLMDAAAYAGHIA